MAITKSLVELHGGKIWVESEVGAFHILIVDDEPVNQQVLANHLTLGKYRFSQAYNGEEALLARIKTHLNLLKINTAFGRFVPRAFLRYLQKESVVEVNLGDHTQMEVTIFVSDIRCFTAISGKMTPAERVKRNEPAINIGVGLHTGNLMLGIVGEQERMQGDIFSDAVNLTNRIEGLCKFYGASIVVSEITLSKLANRGD